VDASVGDELADPLKYSLILSGVHTMTSRRLSLASLLKPWM
jgi:hypothetical protein